MAGAQGLAIPHIGIAEPTDILNSLNWAEETNTHSPGFKNMSVELSEFLLKVKVTGFSIAF